MKFHPFQWDGQNFYAQRHRRRCGGFPRGPLLSLPSRPQVRAGGSFLESHLPGSWSKSPRKRVGSKGLDSARAAVGMIMAHDSLSELLRSCVALTGDTDTVASIALACAACSGEVNRDLPRQLLQGLEKSRKCLSPCFVIVHNKIKRVSVPICSHYQPHAPLVADQAFHSPGSGSQGPGREISCGPVIANSTLQGWDIEPGEQVTIFHCILDLPVVIRKQGQTESPPNCINLLIIYHFRLILCKQFRISQQGNYAY
ncbi:MAG: hypothetical protein U5L00_05110 [Desulfovermiculus sp.]|nr:hypothetical protein [Desulfovermiculus sp.]